MASMMKKTYYYEFLLSKKEEEFASLSNLAPQVTRTLVEIREEDPVQALLLPILEPGVNPWKIRKRLETHEIATGRILLTHEQVFEHVFRHSTLESARSVVSGNKVYATVCDLTDETSPVVYGPYDNSTFLVRGSNDDQYFLGVNMDLIRVHGLNNKNNIGNREIGIFFDPRTQAFYVKIFA